MNGYRYNEYFGRGGLDGIPYSVDQSKRTLVEELLTSMVFICRTHKRVLFVH